MASIAPGTCGDSRKRNNLIFATYSEIVQDGNRKKALRKGNDVCGFAVRWVVETRGCKVKKTIFRVVSLIPRQQV